MTVNDQYLTLQKRLARGWNTWNTRSVLSHVLLPHGLTLNLCLKDYDGGQYLKEALIGRQGKDDEAIVPGSHAYDGAYTDLVLTWRGIEVQVQTAKQDNDLLMLVTPRKLPLSAAALVVEAGFLWNRPGSISRHGNSLVAHLPQGGDVPIFAVGTQINDPHIPAQTPYLTLRLDGPTGLSTGKPRTLDEMRVIVEAYRAQHESRFTSTLHAAIQTCLAWDTIYEPAKERVVTPVSRIWNCNWGGYVLFEWDTYFAAALAAAGDGSDFGKDLAYANAVEMTREHTENGLVPNFASPLASSRDRSEPPVGALVVADLYRKFGDRWLVELLFDDLLVWNRWWEAARSQDGLLCWGSTPFEPVMHSHYETTDVGNRQGAAYESGLDNSPMYDDIPFDAAASRMQLWDVGLNGLYIADCGALAELAELLGRTSETEELRRRGEAYAARLQSLWSEPDGIFLNRRADTGEFSHRLSPTHFYPLIGRAATDRQAERMIREHFYNPAEFWGEWMIPSIARNDPGYPDQNYWRGRIWGPMNYLVYQGLRRYDLPIVQQARVDLAAKSQALLMREGQRNGHVHENYNADTGEGCDIHSSDRYYHWGALLGLVALLEGW